MGELDALLEAIEEECSAGVWTRAHGLARSGTLDGQRTDDDEIEVRLVTRGGMASPLVVLAPKACDWSCECPSGDAACLHVAAAALAVHDALSRGDELTVLRAPVARVAYRLSRREGSLAIERFLGEGDAMTPLDRRLVTRRRHDGDGIVAAQQDLAVDVALGSLGSGRIPRPAMPNLLAALAECDDIQLEGEPITIGDPHPGVRVVVDDAPGGFRVQMEQDPGIEEIFDNGALRIGRVLHAFGDPGLGTHDIDELRKGRVWEHGDVADLVGRVLPTFRERVPVLERSKLLPHAQAMQPTLSFRNEYDGSALTVLPLLVYGDPPCARVDADKLHHISGPLPIRDLEAEARLRALLEDQLSMQPGRVQRFEGAAALDAADQLRRLRGVRLEGGGLEHCYIGEPLALELGTDGPRLRADTPQGRHSARIEAALDAWERGDSLVPLLEGGWAPLPPDLFERIGPVLADLVAARGDDEKLPPAALPDLGRLAEALNAPPPPELKGLRPLLQDFEGLPTATLPDDLRATLRSYQRSGIDWLNFLSRAGLGAMLADDMGLGKTLQALCVLGRPALVVCPASVLHNWRAEIERFRPALRVHVYHGPTRELDPDADVTLTTYAILRIDADALAANEWDTVVLDEAQQIKNPDSQVARAAYGLKARFRITLSGTPVENRLDELWSQMHFLNRGLLGGREDFRRRYSQPIEAGDEAALTHLRARLRPFLLRRRKQEVAPELPPRTEIVLRCELDERERTLYDAVLAATRAEVVAELEAGGNVLKALEALLRLRQACCHSALLPGQHAAGSSKLSLLMETLDEAVAEGHKALVFSQWTSLLDLVEPELARANIGHTRLDGTTRDRGAVVEQFQDPTGPPVMLLSLKAGGVGLNLTAADHVFLLDPWWNPAVEDQAADRAHRIGQDRAVLIHRLVAADSVEERILALQDRKRELADAAIGEGGAAKGITRDDLLALLK